VYRYLPDRPTNQPYRPQQPAPQWRQPVPPPQQPSPPRRRSGLAFVAGAAVAALLVAAIVFGRPILDRLASRQPTNPTGAPTLQPTNDTQTSTQTPTAKPSSASPSRPAGMPDWVPADWSSYVDRPAGDLWRSQDETEGGRCEITGSDLRVTRDAANGLVGCTILDPLNPKFADSAVQVEVTVTSGCAGLWTRTGSQGYFVTICNSAVNLYLLGDKAPGNSNRLANWPLGPAPKQLLVGLLAKGNDISVYAAGKLIGTVTDTTVRSGHDNAGGYTTGTDPVDVTFHQFRVWAPPSPPPA
jgi:hypothetical protein